MRRLKSFRVLLAILLIGNLTLTAAALPPLPLILQADPSQALAPVAEFGVSLIAPHYQFRRRLSLLLLASVMGGSRLLFGQTPVPESEKSTVELIEDLGDVRANWDAYPVLKERGRDVVPALLAALPHANRFVLSNILGLLRDIPDPQSIGPLIDFIHRVDQDPALQIRDVLGDDPSDLAIVSLGKFNDPAALTEIHRYVMQERVSDWRILESLVLLDGWHPPIEVIEKFLRSADRSRLMPYLDFLVIDNVLNDPISVPPEVRADLFRHIVDAEPDLNSQDSPYHLISINWVWEGIINLAVGDASLKPWIDRMVRHNLESAINQVENELLDLRNLPLTDADHVLLEALAPIYLEGGVAGSGSLAIGLEVGKRPEVRRDPRFGAAIQRSFSRLGSLRDVDAFRQLLQALDLFINVDPGKAGAELVLQGFGAYLEDPRHDPVAALQFEWDLMRLWPLDDIRMRFPRMEEALRMDFSEMVDQASNPKEVLDWVKLFLDVPTIEAREIVFDVLARDLLAGRFGPEIGLKIMIFELTDFSFSDLDKRYPGFNGAIRRDILRLVESHSVPQEVLGLLSAFSGLPKNPAAQIFSDVLASILREQLLEPPVVFQIIRLRLWDLDARRRNSPWFEGVIREAFRKASDEDLIGVLPTLATPMVEWALSESAQTHGFAMNPVSDVLFRLSLSPGFLLDLRNLLTDASLPSAGQMNRLNALKRQSTPEERNILEVYLRDDVQEEVRELRALEHAGRLDQVAKSLMPADASTLFTLLAYGAWEGDSYLTREILQRLTTQMTLEKKDLDDLWTLHGDVWFWQVINRVYPLAGASNPESRRLLQELLQAARRHSPTARAA